MQPWHYERLKKEVGWALKNPALAARQLAGVSVSVCFCLALHPRRAVSHTSCLLSLLLSIPVNLLGDL